MDSSKLILTAVVFNEKINQRDLEGLAELMTDDHTFVDNDGVVTEGKDVMLKSWKAFFEKYPDYRNVFTFVAVQDDVVVMVGYSYCSCKSLCGSNMWTARIRDGRVSEWRVCWLDKRRRQDSNSES
jgi:ketosteroid isomerase-like protein